MHVLAVRGWISRARRFFLVAVIPIALLHAVFAGPGVHRLQAEEVVAEGVGTTSEDALKDAFRNSVRQVVGALVDAETLVKNDEIIDDKVLTYSDGFIKSYEEVPDSKKIQGGLHRLKIKATVERRSVIAKLKAASITVKEIDGKGLFAEVVTQLDAEKDAASLLKKQLEGFPQSCITATIIGKPEILEKTADNAKVKIVVQVEPDLQAYKAFSARITPILSKIAKSKGEFTGTFGKHESRQNLAELSAVGDGGYGNTSLLPTWIPKAFDGQGGGARFWKKDQLTIAVATSRTKAADKIDYSFFEIDTTLQPVLVELASRFGKGKLQLLDTQGDAIATERFSLVDQASDEDRQSGNFAGTLVAAFGGPFGNSSYVYELGLTVCREYDSEFQDAKKQACLFLISPTFFASRGNSLGHKPILTIPCKLSLGLDELKSVKDAKIEVTFDE